MEEDIQLYDSFLIHDGYYLKFIDNNIYRRLGLHNCIGNTTYINCKYVLPM